MALGTDYAGFGHGQNAQELTYLVEAGMTPSWHYPGDITYILADADRAKNLD